MKPDIKPIQAILWATLRDILDLAWDELEFETQQKILNVLDEDEVEFDNEDF